MPMTQPALALQASAAPLSGDLAGVLQTQMQTMQAVFAGQLRLLGNPSAMPVITQAPAVSTPPVSAPVPVADNTPSAPAPRAEPARPPPTFKVGRAPSLAGMDLTAQQQSFGDDLTARYSAKFSKSKARTQENRDVHADPRTVSGFRPEWKELTFPIVAARSKGAFFDDLDGNRFVDLVNGFGQTAFGHFPDFVTKAVSELMDRGFAIGQQSDNAGPVARRFARMTGHDRA
ncbi:MAG: hypothetical protein ACI8R4_000301 [Paracoccaceae bacterium]|jgi:hypothetical protein